MSSVTGWVPLLLVVVLAAGCAAPGPHSTVPRSVRVCLEERIPRVWGGVLMEDNGFCSSGYVGALGAFEWDDDAGEVLINTRFAFLPREMKRKYFFSWALHFSGCTASIVDVPGESRRQAVIYAPDKEKESDPYFLCCREQSGDWHEALRRKLLTRYDPPFEQMVLANLIQDIADKLTVSFIVELAAWDHMQGTGEDGDYRPVVVSMGGGTHRADVLLGRKLTNAGLAFRLQGGAIYVFSTTAPPGGAVSPSTSAGIPDPFRVEN